MYKYVQRTTLIVNNYDAKRKNRDGDAGGMDSASAFKLNYAGPATSYKESGKFHKSPFEESEGKSSKNFTAGTLFPVYKTFENPKVSPASVYQALRKDYGFLLESMEGSGKNARYSVIGTGLLMHLTADPLIRIKGPFNPAPEFEGAYVNAETLHGIIRCIDYRCPDIPGYSGGLAGYFSYDLSLNTLLIIDAFDENTDFPLAEFMLCEEMIIFDHEKKTITVLRFLYGDDLKNLEESEKNALDKLNESERKICETGKKNSDDKNFVFEDEKKVLPLFLSGVSKDDFEQSVRDAKEHILNGDIFQVVVSKRCECEYQSDPFLIYLQMRRINPSPYMYFMDFSGMQVAGASPEMLVKVEGRDVMSVPIAGTRIRGKTPEEDLELEKDLLSDKKECAEHLMLVDLSRNDIGRVCRCGSVEVSEFMKVEKFSHVQHIVSVVKGELLDGKTSSDAFFSCFPAGTVSGAPKISAMNIINSLENTKRGLYAGAVGYIGFNENIDFAITIRTVVIKGKKAYFQSGAGIVADSSPESEFFESENKAKSMKSAIESAGAF